MRKATNTKIKHWVPVSEESENLLINFICHGNKSPQAWQLKTTEIHSLTVVEGRNSESASLGPTKVAGNGTRWAVC